MRKTFFHLLLSFVSVFWITVFFISPLQAALPRQDVVLVIDNSGSMKDTDPQRLRGVAANLILDAAELTSDVSAGLVFFSDQVTADPTLESPRKIRHRLQADSLPTPQGATTMMKNALEAALNLLSSSGTDIKKIILITDGVPTNTNGNGRDSDQIKAIRTELVERAKSSGIKIFALGFSNATDKDFLDQICKPTGGSALIAANTSQLLERAKELLGSSDNITMVENKNLAAGDASFTFSMPKGLDQVKLTTVLNSPNLFRPNQLEISMSGPGGVLSRDDGTTYTNKKNDETYMAAWTCFLEKPAAGDYTITITSGKPGFSNHRGAKIIIEARSNLDLSIKISPEKDYYTAGEEVLIDVGVANPTGSVSPDQVKGVVVTKEDVREKVRFNGGSGKFVVPASAGRQRIDIEVRIKGLPPLFSEVFIQAQLQPPPALVTDPEKVRFIKTLGPEFPEVQEKFSIFPVFPEENQRQGRVQTQVRWASSPALTIDGEYLPIGDWARIGTETGGDIPVDGKRKISIPREGSDLTLTMAFPDLTDTPLLTKLKGTVTASGILEIFSDEAANPVEIPVEIQVRIPSFELTDAKTHIALWWKPDCPYDVELGQVLTDSNKPAEFSVTLPRYIRVSKGPSEAKNRPIAEVGLLQDGEVLDGVMDGDQIRYAGFELTKKETPLRVRIFPLTEGDKSTLVRGSQPFTVSLASAFGNIDQEIQLWSAGPPMWSLAYAGPFSPHGMHLICWFLSLLLMLAVWRTFRKTLRVRRESPWRTGRSLEMRPGTISLGGGTALELPAVGSSLDDKVVGKIRNKNGDIVVSGSADRALSKNHRPLSRREDKKIKMGDIVSIGEDDPILELEVTDIYGGEMEVEIVESPYKTGYRKVWVRFGLFFLGISMLMAILRSDAVAGLAYRLPFVDGFYYGVLLPLLS